MAEIDQHLTDEQVVEWIESDLDADAFGATHSHLSSCRKCRQTVGSFRRLMDSFAITELEIVPPHLRERVYDLINEPMIDGMPTRSSDAGTSIASLVFDRPIEVPAFRSEVPADARLMRFATDRDCIDLELIGTGVNEVRVFGDILSSSSVRTAKVRDVRGGETEVTIDGSRFEYLTGKGSELRFLIELDDHTISFNCWV